MIVVNYKNYKYGKSAVELAKKIKKYVPNAIIAVPDTEIREISTKVKIDVFAQHLDPYKTDRGTGYLLAEAIKKAGATGTIINHAEHKIPLSHLKETLKRCEEMNLKTLVCAASLREAKKIAKMPTKPWAIAFEDPKLISTGKSITQYNPRSLRRFIKFMDKTIILPFCGAGISSAKDVMQAYEMGCKGVLIASAIAKSDNPEKLLSKLK